MLNKQKFLASEIARLSSEFNELGNMKKDLDHDTAFVVVARNDLSYNKCFSFGQFVVQTDLIGATVFDSSDKCKSMISISTRSICHTKNSECIDLYDLIVLRRHHLRGVIKGLKTSLDKIQKM